jgi:hypothetical protein
MNGRFNADLIHLALLQQEQILVEIEIPGDKIGPAPGGHSFSKYVYRKILESLLLKKPNELELIYSA